MTKFQYLEEPIVVSRDPGFNLGELIPPKNRKKAHERVKDPDYLNSKYVLKGIFAGMGIIVNPEAMTFWYRHTK